MSSHLPRARGPKQACLLTACLIAAAPLFLSGCGDPVSSYRLPDHDPRTAQTILVLPFLDARTFRADRDPVNGKLETVARDIFVEAMQDHPAFRGKTILRPEVGRDRTSLSLAEALDYGLRFNADLVVAGQVFSYMRTRAASIPPRAGLFVRIFSVPDKRMVFVGDDYKYAGGPGARGGRRLQAEVAAKNLLQSYVASKPAGGTARGRSNRSVPDVVKQAPEDAPAILVLPFHERPNPNNLIEKTGGGAVVSSLYSMELGRLGFAHLLTPATEAAGHSTLLTPEQALDLARTSGADYVLRGQVVEFRRAMSVPSFYSVLISTALLAAQILFAEFSGVDIATELWRVEDGACVYAKRDASKQKYVVQAEKTVRRLAKQTARDIRQAIRKPPQTAARPLIDTIEVADRTRDGADGEQPDAPETPARTEAETQPGTAPATETKDTPPADHQAKPAEQPEQAEETPDAAEGGDEKTAPRAEDAATQNAPEPGTETQATERTGEDAPGDQAAGNADALASIVDALRKMATRIQALQEKTATDDGGLDKLAAEMEALATALEADPNADVETARKQLRALRDRLESAEKRLTGDASPVPTRLVPEDDEDY